MCQDFSFGHPYQSAYVLVLVQYLVNAVMPHVVKQSVSTVTSGNAQGPIAQGGIGNKCAMISITAVNAPAVSLVHIFTCKLKMQNRKITICYSY